MIITITSLYAYAPQGNNNSLEERLLLSFDEAEEFVAGFEVSEGSCEVGGGGEGMGFLDTTHLHAEVLCFDNNHYSEGIECVLNSVFYLRGHGLWHLQTASEDIHHASDFA